MLPYYTSPPISTLPIIITALLLHRDFAGRGGGSETRAPPPDGRVGEWVGVRTNAGGLCRTRARGDEPRRQNCVPRGTGTAGFFASARYHLLLLRGTRARRHGCFPLLYIAYIIILKAARWCYYCYVRPKNSIGNYTGRTRVPTQREPLFAVVIVRESRSDGSVRVAVPGRRNARPSLLVLTTRQ